ALDYLRSSDDAGKDRKLILEVISSLEGVGPQRIAQILPLLPEPLDAAGGSPGQTTTIQASAPRDEVQISYSVYLPPEYHAEQSYPVILALHSEGRGPAHEVAFWAGNEERAGQASRHGYIVVAPDYTTKQSQEHYTYGATAHAVILGALRDAGRRFNIDHNRVFLSGHMMGGDAAFDIGFSHPDLFAGVIPIAGVSDQICQFYWKNAINTPFFVVLGELDRETVYRNTRELDRMMKARFDLVFAEYVGSGPDSFYGEIHTLFDWMSRLQRNRFPKKFEAQVLRNTENRFYWLDIGDVPAANRYSAADGDRKATSKPLRISAELVQPGNRIEVTNRTSRTKLRLSPEAGFVNFDKKLLVNVNGKQRFSDFLKPDTEAMLEYARIHGDRRNVCWAVLEL
ncbi:MAG: alpha/beta hydrolase-fold protein, partial [Planctomycetota bacterium]|nr:alpha/beta hydrolase-fold protein [Planctomycetota bacterium]